MHVIARVVLLYLAALTVAVASLAAGHARGQAPVAGQIVICHGLTAVTIHVDADGQPTTANQTCPDAVLHLSDAPYAMPEVGLEVRLVGLEFTSLDSVALSVVAVAATLARGPPIRA